MHDKALAEALLAPRAVALVGASADAAKNTARPLRYLRRHGYGGRVYPVNPGAGEVQGAAAWPRVADLPEPVQHALVMVPGRAVPGVLRDCAAGGVRVVTVYSDGFADAGPAGAARQRELAALAASLGLRLLGPNSMGVINVQAGLALSVNAALDAERLLPGGLSLISQSGSMLGALLSRGQARGLGFARLLSVGNEADLTVGELTGALVDDADTQAILLFLEALRDAPRLAAAARRAYAAGKPVIAYKLGRSDAGRALAASHTGAITGGAAAVSAFLRAQGIVEVRNLEALLETAHLLRGRRPPRGRRVAVVTTSGGGAATVVDALGDADIETVPAPPGTVAALREHGLEVGGTPIIDLTMAGTRRGVYGAALAALAAEAECDAVLAVVGSSAQFHPELAVQPIVDAPRAGKALAAFMTPQADRSLTLLGEAGVAAFRTPESCAEALRAYLDWRAPAPPCAVALPAAAGEALAALRAAGVARAGEHACAPLLDALGLRRPRSAVLRDAREVPALRFPLALKVISAELAHKTEAGAVVLGVADASALPGAHRALLAQVRERAPHARIDGVLAEEMVSGLAEVLLGYRLDPEAGPLVTVGAGGILAELYRDVATRPAPVDPAGAREMLAEVRGLAPLTGYRGLAHGDLDALAAALSALSALALAVGPRVAEAEINPLIVAREGEGVWAVDALLVFAPEPDGDGAPA